MAVYSKDFKIKSFTDGLFDITENISEILSQSGFKDGIIVVFCPGSTGAISTVEFEPGLLKDVPKALEKIAPSNVNYEHHNTWHDDNGRSHVKATLLGPSLTVPFRSKKLVLGTWQQIVFLEFDTKPRERTLVVQVLGE